MLAVLLLTSLGCSPSRKALREVGKETDLLRKSAEIYWQAVRWRDGARAGTFIEDAQVRVAFEDWLADAKESEQVVDVRVVHVQVGPRPAEDDPDAPRRTGEVVVRTESYTLPEQVLREQTVTQTWVRGTHGWLVEWP